ncbi:hypothetical protein AL346_22095 (plasmid) [Chelatococcus sp. CO-6]|nr:hypothetical protein AL346_22095 [Chelatococcus sp. CO-6]
MVRNFRISNGRPPRPLRVCLKMMGPLESHRMTHARTRKRGISSSRPMVDRMMSMMRLAASDHIGAN